MKAEFVKKRIWQKTQMLNLCKPFMEAYNFTDPFLIFNKIQENSQLISKRTQQESVKEKNVWVLFFLLTLHRRIHFNLPALDSDITGLGIYRHLKNRQQKIMDWKPKIMNTGSSSSPPSSLSLRWFQSFVGKIVFRSSPNMVGFRSCSSQIRAWTKSNI